MEENKAVLLASLFEELSRNLYHSNTKYGHRSQGKLLKILSRRQTASQKDLQKMLHIQPGSMSEIVTKLERKGLISRSRDTEDNRKVILSITEQGIQDVKDFQENYSQNVVSIFEVLDTDEKKELEKIFLKLLNHLNRKEDGT